MSSNEVAATRARLPAPRREFLRARVREATIDSFWVVPAVFLAGAVVMSYLLGRLDESTELSVWWVGTVQAAADVLGTIAASMLTFLGVVFSITLVALQLASQQFSPRITRTFVRSTTTKVAFGVFSATFLTALLSLSRIEEGSTTETGPVASVTVSLLMVGASLVVFIVFVTAITRLIRIAHLVAAVADETRAALGALYLPSESYRSAPPPQLVARPVVVAVGPTRFRTRRRSRGVLLGIDAAALVQLAEEHDCVISFPARVGQYLSPGTGLAEIHGSTAPRSDRVRHAVQFGRERTLYEDPAYGIRELVDIGCQALSSAVNAPTTAVQVIDRLTDLLTRIGSSPDPTGMFTDASGVVRLIVPVPTWEEVVDLVFNELTAFGAGSPQVTRRLAAAIEELTRSLPAARHPALEARLTLLAAAARDRWPDEGQRSHALRPDPLGLG